MADTLGRPLWYELLTTDMKTAEAFYSAVVGWSVMPFRPAPDAYDMFARAADTPVGGVMTIPTGMNFPPHWEMYVGVPSLDDAIAKVERLGGSGLSGVITVPNVGRLRVMKDPQGAVFTLFEPSDAPLPDAAPQVGDVSWHELNTTDAAAAMAFYSEMFGWTETRAVDMGPMGKYHIFGRNGRDIGGMMKLGPEMGPVPPSWNLYFHVSNVHEAAMRVTANGGTVMNGPMDVPGGDEIVNCLDPQGGAFSLHARKA
jgi:uncharacterized protein